MKKRDAKPKPLRIQIESDLSHDDSRGRRSKHEALRQGWIPDAEVIGTAAILAGCAGGAHGADLELGIRMNCLSADSRIAGRSPNELVEHQNAPWLLGVIQRIPREGWCR